MRHLAFFSGLMFVGALVAATGCRKADESPAPQTAPAGETAARKPPQSHQSPHDGEKLDIDRMMAEAMSKGQLDLPPGHPPIGTTRPADEAAMGTTMPAGHPPVGTMPAGAMTGTTLPAGHPPIGGQQPGPMAFSGDVAAPEKMLDFKPPQDWRTKSPRPMTVAVYAVPKPANAPADAEVTVSHYPGMKNVPLDMQVKRWAGQFTQPDGQPGQAKQTELQNAAHPTTLVDIAGTYNAGSVMMSGGPAPKTDYRMLVGVVQTDQGPWFVRFVGPQATVNAREKEFLDFVRQAK